MGGSDGRSAAEGRRELGERREAEKNEKKRVGKQKRLCLCAFVCAIVDGRAKKRREKRRLQHTYMRGNGGEKERRGPCTRSRRKNDETTRRGAAGAGRATVPVTGRKSSNRTYQMEPIDDGARATRRITETRGFHVTSTVQLLNRGFTRS